jgi:hypothetical protein
MATTSKSSNTTIRTSQRHQSAINTPPMYSHNQRNNTPQENTSSNISSCSNKSSQLKRKTSSSSPETRDERAVAAEQRTNIIIEHQRSSLAQHPLPPQPRQHPITTKYTDQAQLQPPAKKSRASTCLPTTCSTITHRSPPPLPQLPILFHHPLSHYSYLSSTSSNINNISNSSYMSSSHHRLSPPPPPPPLQTTTTTTTDNSTSNKTSKTSNSDLNYQSRQSLFLHHPHFFSPQIQPNTSKNSELNAGGATNFLNCDYILF